MWLWWQIIQGGDGENYGEDDAEEEADGEEDCEDHYEAVGEDDGEDVHLRSHHDLEAVDNAQRSAHDVNLFEDQWIDCDDCDSDDKNYDEEEDHLASVLSSVSNSNLIYLQIKTIAPANKMIQMIIIITLMIIVNHHDSDNVWWWPTTLSASARTWRPF